MNSDIASVVKLPSATIVKADKPAEDKSVASSARVDGAGGDAVASLQNDPAAQKPSADVVKKAVDQGNSLLQSVNRSVLFKMDESTHEVVVKIVDSESGKLIRQIPSEDMLAFTKRMQELESHKGAVIQDRA